MLDLNLLRLIKNRKDFFELEALIPKGKPLDDLTVTMVNNFGRYFEAFPTHEKVDLNNFASRFRIWYPQLKDDQLAKYFAVIRLLQIDPDDDTRQTIINDLSELALFTEVANLASQHDDGDLRDGVFKLNSAVDEHKRRCGIKALKYIDTPIDELLQEEFDDSGLKWRLDCINRSTRGLRPGDFGIIAARPDKGKTSFLASEITFMASQLPEERNVLWLNNEGPGKRIIPRLYQAALDMDMRQLKEASTSGGLQKMYRDAMGGRKDRIRVVDIHGRNTVAVETLIEENNAGVVIYDMIDKIRGFGEAARTDLMLEEMYDWARNLAVRYGLVGLATSQISNEGDGLQFPTLGMLKDSKTGKQGACDFQIMIGASNDPLFTNSRWISMPKNKLRKPEGPSDPRTEVLFNGLKSRYVDIPMEG